MLGLFVLAAAGFVLALALLLRLYNVGWDDNTHLHPDERHLTIVATDIRLPGSISEYFDSASSRLNPYNREGGGSFVYGTLPLFLTKGTAALLGLDDYDHLVLVGRYLSALFDVGSVLLVFLIGRRLYGQTAGLVGAAFMAMAPLAIQHSHFFVVDPFLTFFTTLVLFASVRIAREGRPTDYALAGLALGLGMACKVTAVLVSPVIGVAVLLRYWPALRALTARTAPASPGARREVTRGLLGLLLAVVLAFLAFRVAQPYAFEAPRLANLAPWTIRLDTRWSDDQKQQSRLLGGEVGFPPSVQWIDRESYLYPLQEMLLWGMGPGFGIAGWLSLVYAAYRIVRRRELVHLLPVVFVAVYFGVMGRQFSLYLRYFLPLYPVLAVLAGWGTMRLVEAGVSLSRRWQRPAIAQAGYALAGTTMVVALLAALAYFSIYSRPVTRVEASYWLYDNLPAGSRIMKEHWDDTVPMQLPGSADKQFSVTELPLYDLDTPDKVARLLTLLDQADYVVLSSNRLLNSIPRLPFNYPVTSRYYDLLLDGALGFRLLHEFTSYPGLLGIEFPDHGASESWSSYDHPRVLLFEKTASYTPANARSLLGQGPFATLGLTPKQGDRHGLMLEADDLAAQRKGGTWTSVFSDSGIAASYPTLLWLGTVELAALAVTPLGLVLFRRLPDRGYLLSKPLGLLLLGYAAWLVVSLGVVSFSQTTVLAVLAALCSSGVLAFRVRRREIIDFARENWRLIVFCELLFLLAFLLFRELRLLNPDLWHPFRGGEKPMDLAYLTAVTRSTTLPPYDPWFAGGYINYYYLGHFFTATLSRLTTIPPEVAFNLAVPTYFALTCAGAFSIAYNLAAAARGLLRSSIPSARLLNLYVAGLLGVFLVAIAGNLDGVGQLAQRLAAISPWQIESSLPLLPALINSAGGLWQVVVHGASLGDFDYWRSSRMLPPTISITEFPYFSFLFADLHAHMMAIPFQVLAIGGALAIALSPADDRDSWRDWCLAGLLGLIVGSLRWLNSWDYPPFLLLAFAAVVIGERHLRGGFTATAGRVVLKSLLVAAVSLLFFRPFLDSYQSPASGLHASPETTPLHQYLAHFGVLLALAGGWLAFASLRAWRTSPLARLDEPGFGRERHERDWLFGSLIGVCFVAAACLYLIATGHAFVAVVVPFLALTAVLALRELWQRRPDGGVRLFLLALLGLGLGLSAGVDLVTINGDINRMNTVFKFYLHAWVVFALVAAFAAWWLLFEVLPAVRFPNVTRTVSLAGATAGAAIGLLLLAAAVYPVFATPVRLDDRFASLPPTLDGTAFMRAAVYGDPKGPIELAYDLEGIRWLRENVEGTPVIVEGRADLYRWGGRFSIYTGLPAVVGWDWHQRQQRGQLAGLVEQRGQAVDAFYRDANPAQALRFLRLYSVEYVVLGQLERLYYPGEGLLLLESGLGGVLEPVFSNARLTIFHVRTDPLARATSVNP